MTKQETAELIDEAKKTWMRTGRENTPSPGRGRSFEKIHGRSSKEA